MEPLNRAKLTQIRVYFANGFSLVTRINCSLEDAQNYYVGQKFELDENKPMVECVRVEQIG